MATAGSPMAASGTSLADLGNLAALFTSKSGSSSTQTNITPEAMQAILTQILGGTAGLASVANGEKTAGLYGSSTNQLLTNDLLTTAAQKAALAGASTTTTKREDPALSPGKTAAAIGGLSLVQNLLKDQGGLAGLVKQFSGSKAGITTPVNTPVDTSAGNDPGVSGDEYNPAGTPSSPASAAPGTIDQNAYSLDDLDAIDWTAILGG